MNKKIILNITGLIFYTLSCLSYAIADKELQRSLYESLGQKNQELEGLKPIGRSSSNWPSSQPPSASSAEFSWYDEKFNIYLWRGDSNNVWIKIEPIGSQAFICGGIFDVFQNETLRQNNGRSIVKVEHSDGTTVCEDVLETSIFKLTIWSHYSDKADITKPFMLSHSSNGKTYTISFNTSTIPDDNIKACASDQKIQEFDSFDSIENECSRYDAKTQSLYLPNVEVPSLGNYSVVMNLIESVPELIFEVRSADKQLLNLENTDYFSLKTGTLVIPKLDVLGEQWSAILNQVENNEEPIRFKVTKASRVSKECTVNITRSCSDKTGEGVETKLCGSDEKWQGEFGSCEFSNCNSGYKQSGSQCIPVDTILDSPPVLTASQQTYPDRIDLSWNSVPNATGYVIYTSRNISGGYYPPLETVSSSTTKLSITGLRQNSPYYYRIAVIKDGLKGRLGPAVEGRTGQYMLISPSGLAASQGTYPDRVDLSWNAVPNATEYAIYDSSSFSGNYTRIGGTYSPKTSRTVTGVPQNTTRYYKVRAANDGIVGQASTPVRGYTRGQDDASETSLSCHDTYTKQCVDYTLKDESTKDSFENQCISASDVNVVNSCTVKTGFGCKHESSTGTSVTWKYSVPSSTEVYSECINTGGIPM